MALAAETKITFAVLLVGAAVLFVAYRAIKSAGVAGVTSGIVSGTADAAAGAVLGVGDVLGVPRTDQTECDKAIAEGRTWDASFACPAGRFLKSLVGGQ